MNFIVFLFIFLILGLPLKATGAGHREAQPNLDILTFSPQASPKQGKTNLHKIWPVEL